MPLRVRLVLPLLLATAVQAKVLTVGPGKHFSTPCKALASARPGDTVEIEAATYEADVCAFTANDLTIRGVNGRPKISAAGKYAASKGIWVVEGNNNVIENVEIYGAKVPDRNGAAVRLDGVGLTLRRVYFHDNEDGLLTNNNGGRVLIEYSEFARNGDGQGYAHNIYVGRVDSFTMRYSYTHHALVGGLVKSRARETQLLYNRISEEADGVGSWEVDLPDGGRCTLLGNIIQQGPKSQNSNILSFQTEGAPWPESMLNIVNNTFVNDGSSSGTFLLVRAHNGVRLSGIVQNNIFAGPGLMATPEAIASLQFKNNLLGPFTGFVDAVSNDYRLKLGSKALDAGSPPESADLTPRFEYVHPVSGQPRPQHGRIDIGAYEFNPRDPAGR